MQGSLTHETLAEVIRTLYVNRRSGILHLEQDGASKRIYFRKGSMIFANSDTESDWLGEFLIRQGVIDRQALDEAAGEIKKTGHRFGRTLVELGHVTADEMQRRVVEQIETIIYSLFSWESGEYRFQQHESPVDEDIVLNLSTADIILEGTRRMEDMDRIRLALGDPNRCFRPSEDPLLLYQKMSTLSQSEYFILSRVDGSTTLSEILSISPIPEDAALRCIYGLISAGVLESGGASEREPAVRTEVSAGGAEEAAELEAAEPAADPGEAADPRPEIEPPAERSGPSAEELAMREAIIEKHAALGESTAYDLLGISTDATDAEVKRAYYKMAKRYHPDRHHSPELEDVHGLLEELFGRITQAYQFLADPAERKRYDARTAAGAAEGESSPNGGASREPAGSEEMRKRTADERFREGKRLYDEMNYFDAIQCLRDAIRLHPTKECHKLLARALMKNPKWAKEAEAQLKLAIELDGLDAECYLELGRLYESAGMTMRAQKMYQKAVSCDPVNEAALAKLEKRSDSGIAGVKRMLGSRRS